jgi:cytoplasmic iron level regulating protein YaaA (DUF328/UPF0246 family)
MNIEQINELIEKDLKKKANRIAYIAELTEEQDWHGLMDVSADLREIEERLFMYQWWKANL